LDWLRLIILNRFAAHRAEFPVLLGRVSLELAWIGETGATVSAPILLYNIGTFLRDLRYHWTPPVPLAAREVAVSTQESFPLLFARQIVERVFFFGLLTIRA
jgi:hypothetical protein